MKRSIIILVLLLLGTQVIFVSAQSDEYIPTNIRYNRYYLESLSYTNLARLAYEEGDYDTSVRYSEEAIKSANLSDEYVRLRLRMREVDMAIFAAGRRLEYAASVNADTRFPVEYAMAQNYYGDARAYRTAEQWDDAIDAANQVIAILALIDGGGTGAGLAGGPGSTSASSSPVLPSQYTVRLWDNYKDCLWNIAGRPWVYNDPWKWRILYDANKSKMPETDNPDLIKPGMVLDIPSIKGETRQGLWENGVSYPALP